MLARLVSESFVCNVPYHKSIRKLESFLRDLGVISKIIVDITSASNLKSKGDKSCTCSVRYYSCVSEGYFVNFGGVLYNTKTGYICLGYNANSDMYIPVCSMVDFFNAILCLTDDVKQLFTLEDINYMVECFKINPSDFDFKTYLQELIFIRCDSFNSNSIIKNFIYKYSDKEIDTNAFGFDYNSFPINNFEYFSCLLEGFSKLNTCLYDFAKCFIHKDSLENDFNVLVSNFSSELSGFTVTRDLIEGCYLKGIRDNNVRADFMREVVSCSLGSRARLLAFSSSIDDEKKLKVVSSFYYLNSVTDYSSIIDTVLDTYNIVDMLRSIGRDTDLYFSFDVLYSLKNDNALKSLITRLGLDNEVSRVGYTFFTKYGMEYFKLVDFFISSGSFDLLVTSKQKDFVSVSSRSIISTGKIFERATNRLLKIFDK